MRRNLKLLMICGVSACGPALAADPLVGDALRSVIAGKTVHVATPVGTVPVNFRPDGTMSGRSPAIASYAMTAADEGRWWVSGDRLCQQWSTWFNRSTHCFAMKREGRTLYWTGAGRSGTATIGN